MDTSELKETISTFLYFDDLEFPLWFLIPGLLGTVVTISRMDFAEESKDWPETRGRIISSEVREETSTEAGIPGEGSGQTERIYRAVITYSYSVDSKPYKTDLLTFGTTGFSEENEALALKQKYEPGMDVTVHYKPDNHLIAVIETGRSGFPTMLVVTSIFAFIGLTLFSIAVFNRVKRLAQGKSWSGDD